MGSPALCFGCVQCSQHLPEELRTPVASGPWHSTLGSWRSTQGTGAQLPGGAVVWRERDGTPHHTRLRRRSPQACPERQTATRPLPRRLLPQAPLLVPSKGDPAVQLPGGATEGLEPSGLGVPAVVSSIRVHDSTPPSHTAASSPSSPQPELEAGCGWALREPKWKGVGWGGGEAEA